MTESTNPFLMGGFDTTTATNVDYNPFAASNPFLQQDFAAEAPLQASATNPFAQFFAESFPPPAPAPSSDNVTDLLGDLGDTRRDSDTYAIPSTGHSSAASPTDGKPDRPSAPRRPPPPRPTPPKETKDLILSVTGALEATSSDLLDRLQATRTPSPTPLRELNTPSPITVGELNDLLGDDDIEPPKFAHGLQPHPKQDIRQEALNIFDAIANLSKEENKEPSVLPPVPPPVPAPVPAPVPPAIPPAVPSRPPPPPLPIRCDTDLTNLIGDPAIRSNSRETPQTSRKSSLVSSRKSSVDYRRDIGGDRQSPPKQETPEIIEQVVDADKLFDKPYTATRKASHDVTADRVAVASTRKKYSLDYSGGYADHDVIKERFEQYRARDTSDDRKILETPKFPVISTTPIMSCENIVDEGLYETDKEPSLIFDERSEKTAVVVDPFASFVQDDNRPTPDPFVSFVQNDNRPTPDPFVSFTNAIVEDGDAGTPNDGDPFAAFGLPDQRSRVKDDFDIFQEKFDNVKQSAGADPFDPFGAADAAVTDESGQGFGNEDTFDEFLAMNQPPVAFEAKFDEDVPQNDQYIQASWPDANHQEYRTDTYTANAYPPQPPTTLGDTFDAAITQKISKTDSTETPPTPLFDEDVSQPLEPFPRTSYDGPGWEMQIRYPIRKKFTGQRFWKKVFVRLVYQGETPHLELINKDDGKETLHHEWPLQPCYAISDIGAQQYDQYGKIFTVKIQFVVYKERPGVRPGQVTKAERLTNKLSQFAAYAIQGDYQGVKEFGSDLKKLGLPVEHSPQISLICKLGSHNYEDMKQFSACVEDTLFRLSAHRDNIHINYKMEEVQITAVDELYVEQNSNGSIHKQIARVRLFFLGFLTGMPDVEIGVNDLWRQGKEVVGRHDIIPVVTEEWIRLENVEFHSCVQQDVYEETRTIKLKPPDACYLELMRFRVRPPKNRELPLQLKTTFRICGNKVDILADILVPGFTSRKLGQIPCEDVVVRIPIPECWIYLFRVEKHFRYGSVKSAHRRTGKIKGIERFLGAVDTLEPHLIEVTSGHAKYEHHHKSIVWRMSRLPKEGQGAYTMHNLVCHLALTSYDQIPEELAKYCYVEFTMPVTQVSHTTVRSVSISNSDSDSPPEKYVRHLARHEYRVEIEHTHADSTSDYIAATMVKPTVTPTPARPAVVPEQPAESDSDSE